MLKFSEYMHNSHPVISEMCDHTFSDKLSHPCLVKTNGVAMIWLHEVSDASTFHPIKG